MRSYEVSPSIVLIFQTWFYSISINTVKTAYDLCLNSRFFNSYDVVKQQLVTSVTILVLNYRFAKFGFPNAIGAIDGTLHPPSDHKGDYVTRKSSFAVNLTTVCDADLTFRSIIRGNSGKSHDSHIFRESSLKRDIDNGSIPPKFHLLGDAAYGLHLNLPTPCK